MVKMSLRDLLMTWFPLLELCAQNTLIKQKINLPSFYENYLLEVRSVSLLSAYKQHSIPITSSVPFISYVSNIALLSFRAVNGYCFWE